VTFCSLNEYDLKFKKNEFLGLYGEATKMGEGRFTEKKFALGLADESRLIKGLPALEIKKVGLDILSNKNQTEMVERSVQKLESKGKNIHLLPQK
jgi:hypothetical protein